MIEDARGKRVTMSMRGWLKLFRVVNVPTVPGDVLVGLSAVAALGGCSVSGFHVAASCLAAVALYLFGLADNDIVGAATDGDERPIPAGEITLGATRLARGLCVFLAMVFGAVANLPPFWWIAAFLLALAIVVYNRTKLCLVMGLCRGLNVACGAAVGVSGFAGVPLGVVGALILLWTFYIAAVTKYSQGEEGDPQKRRRVGLLVGAIVYLQLAALLGFYCLATTVYSRNLLLVGAGLLIALRLLKRLLPKVSAS